MIEQTIKPIALFFTIAMGIMTIILPRKTALIPLIVACVYITVDQRIVLFGKDLTIFRIIMLFGWVRLFQKHEVQSIKLHAIDKVIIWWVIASIITGTLMDSSNFVSRLGLAFNAIGLYFLFRCLIRSLDDVEIIAKSSAIIIIPLALSMLIERTTQRNIFSIFGGVPEITMFNAGRLRCQGPFRHPILAGTFGAVWMPIFASLWLTKIKKNRKYAIAGLVSTGIIVYASRSSGPLMASMIGILGFAMWPFRNNMKIIRWGIVCAIIGLQLYMKDPVWFIFARLGGKIGGTGWHRSMIIDTAIRHFSEWWLVGTNYTANWFIQHLPNNPNMIDITNQYVMEGVRGGIVQLFLFILIIVQSYKAVGLSVKTIEERDFPRKIMVWAIGISLTAHVASYLSVCYFDQMIVFWYMLLAIIASVSIEQKERIT